jgi:hypothetical protein
MSRQSAINQIIWELQNVDLSNEQLQIIYRKVYLFANSPTGEENRSMETIREHEEDYLDESRKTKPEWVCIANERGHDVFGRHCGNHLQRITSIDQIERIGAFMLGKESNPEDMADTLREYIRKYGVWVKRDRIKEGYD